MAALLRVEELGRSFSQSRLKLFAAVAQTGLLDAAESSLNFHFRR
jgi:hypothetical protein